MKLPTELIKWFISFMSEISAIIGINDSISQGSPVSPIMFLIFIQHVIGALEHRNEIITLNYADDLAIITESSYARTNSIRLQLVLRRLVKAADEIQIQFDADKSEYIHFHKGRDPIDIRITLTFTTYEGSKTVKVRPQKQFKWLGMWLDRKLTFKKYTKMKCAAATRVFYSIYRLSNILKGLSFQAIRQLYISCVKAIGAYRIPC
jgi:Reverse transcriptase (RNA-dependent DNA polymerase)